MNQIFDFGDIKKNETVIRKTWAEYRSALARKDFEYDETDKALRQTFLKVFDDLHSHMQENLTKPLSFLNTKTLIRGTRLNPAEMPDYQRMLPIAEFIKEDNRFSPPGVEWLYVAVGDNEADAVACSKAECRIKERYRFAYCEFEIEREFGDFHLIDLTIADQMATAEINNRLEKAGEKYKRKTMNRSIKIGIPVPASEEDKTKIKSEIEQWALSTYMKLMSEQIFLPLTDADDKSLMYAPFQSLAQYFITKGYNGIMYKSTVSKNGQNVVLFDKRYAEPVGSINIKEPMA